MATQTASNPVPFPPSDNGPVQSNHTAPPSYGTPLRPQAAPVWPWPTFILGILALAGVWFGRPYWRPTDADRVQRDLTELRRLLDRGPAELDRAMALGKRALDQGDRFPKFVGEAHFLIGSIHLRRFEDAGPTPDAGELQAAVKAFEQAEAGGVPDADQPRLAHRFGKALHLARLEPKTALDRLLRGEDSDNQSERYQLLAEAHLRVEAPNYRAALEATQHQLALIPPGTDQKVVFQARKRQGDLHLRLNEPAEARKVLLKIDAAAPADVYVESRMLLAECLQVEGRWSEAANAWDVVRAHAQLKPAERGAALYKLGLCHSRANKPAEAVAAWNQAQVQGGDAGQAAALRMAELQLANPVERAGAVDALEKALDRVSKPDDFKNAIVPKDEAAQILEKAVLSCRDQSDYANAVKLADLYGKLSPARGRELAAEVGFAWGKALWDEARKGGPRAADALREAKQCFRQAGRAYAEAATDDRPVGERVECLRRATDFYFKAEEKLDFECGLELLERLEKLAPAGNDGEFTFLCALARHNLGQKDKAADEYRAIARQDSNPNAPRARYQLALLLMQEPLPKREEEFAKLDQVAEELEKNLTLAVQEKDRELHEKSMYLLGEVTYHRHEYLKAEGKLEQALRLYPNNARALHAKYMFGRCFWYQAAQESRLLQDKNLPARDQDAAKDRYRKFLARAKVPFDEIERVLLERDEKKAVADEDQALLRQTLFASAECSFYLGDYEDAVRRYKKLRQRYSNQFYELVAVSQLWQCYRNFLNQPEDAKAMVDAVRHLVQTLPDSEYDGSMPICNRDYWKQWLDGASQPAPAAPAAPPP